MQTVKRDSVFIPPGCGALSRMLGQNDFQLDW